MDREELNNLWREYNSYQGTCHNSINKTGVAVENFESVLSAAMSLASELEDLKKERKEPKYEHQSTSQEDSFLWEDEEPDEAKATADFARYG